ncbi:MAG: hypothetical protein ABEI27_14550 [Halobellus sp.]|uniref:hypothetical protein n=1 Tax=Halobellus sp. TaxID=1979212 RepID=UPI0035D3F269
MVWLLMDDRHRPAARQAIGVVLVMVVVGGVATALLVERLGEASVLQFRIAALSFAGFLGVLGYFGLRVGLLSVFTAVSDSFP